MRSTHVLLQWRVKDPGHSAKGTGGRLYRNTRTPLTRRNRSGLTILSGHSTWAYQGNELTRNSSGKAQPQSPQLAESLWTDPGLKSGMGVLELISTVRRRRGLFHQNFSPKTLVCEEKAALRELLCIDWCCIGFQGDVRTVEGVKSVFQQATKDCEQIQHVVAAIRGNKTWWQVELVGLSQSFFLFLPVFTSAFSPVSVLS